MADGNSLANFRRLDHDVYYSDKMLHYTLKSLVAQKFGTITPMPKNVGESITFEADIPPVKVDLPVPLVEGVTPDPKKLSRKFIKAQVAWYGNFLQNTDLLVVMDEDGKNLTNRQTKYLTTLQSEERDTCTMNILLGGTNVIRAGGVAHRNLIDSVINLEMLHLAHRTLKIGIDGRGAKPITSMLTSSGNFGSTDIEASYVVLTPPECEYDIRQLAGFVPASTYPSGMSDKVDPMEIGKVDMFRFVTLENYRIFTGQGAGANGTVMDDGTNINVFPMIVLGEDAYTTIPLTGEQGGKLIIKPLGSSGALDPLNQRATIGYKNPLAAAITYQERMVRLEVASSSLTA